MAHKQDLLAYCPKIYTVDLRRQWSKTRGQWGLQVRTDWSGWVVCHLQISSDRGQENWKCGGSSMFNVAVHWESTTQRMLLSWDGRTFKAFGGLTLRSDPFFKIIPQQCRPNQETPLPRRRCPFESWRDRCDGQTNFQLRNENPEKSFPITCTEFS